MKTRCSIIIAGHGIAGAVLAVTLRTLGQDVLVIDPDEAVTSSKIAAGMVTPITGKRLTLSWRAELCWPVAQAFFSRHWPEHWRPGAQVRLLCGAEEQQRWEARRSSEQGLARWLVDHAPLDWRVFHGPVPSFTMQSAWLDTRPWLSAARTALVQEGGWITGRVSEDAVECHAGGVRLKLDGLAIEARHLVFCQGHAGARNTLFPWLQWRSAKGEILDIECPGLTESRMIHREGWLLPTGGDAARAGSVYNRDRLDSIPTAAARETMIQRLSGTLRLPFSVTGHQAAVRPIIHESKGVIGLHPGRPGIAFFNGLGSKGVLQAPWMADALAGLLVHGIPVDNEVDLQRN